MAEYIVKSKLFIPPLRPSLVARSRLIQKLTLGLDGKLTLISAPAGFGKTTLVSAWISGCTSSVAWLSLDEGDCDPARFIAYFVAALQTVAPAIGDSALALLDSPQPPSIESVMARLLNEITTISYNIVLVLDDYHMLDSEPVDNALTFLLDYLPPQMHLIITTREDPRLPLPRYRVRNQLTEVRASDLRFTSTEVAEFLNQSMGLTLTMAEIAALEARTEGWVAGLQLASLALQGTLSAKQSVETTEKHVGNFIQAFTGGHHFVLEYLVQEVLQRQSHEVRTFLLHTSILDKLCGPLCDALMRGDRLHLEQENEDVCQDGNRMLNSLERGNLFVIPLDEERQWFRYHHLFADVLRAQVAEKEPERVSALHRCASAWFEDNGDHADAVHHAIAGKDFERAANLIELSWREMDRNYQNATSLGWLKRLPDALLRVRPVLNTGYAWALLAEGELEAAEERLQDAERWFNTDTKTREELEAIEGRMVVVDQAELDKLLATIASARTYMAQARGDMPAVVEYANRTLELLPKDDVFERSIPAGLLGLAHWANGDLETAYQSFADVMNSMQRAGKVPFAIGASFVAAFVKVVEGSLDQASRVCQQSLKLAGELGERNPHGVADLYVVQAEINREWGMLDAASECLTAYKGFGASALLPGNEELWYIATARLKESQGDLAGAHAMLDEAARLQRPDPIPDVRPVAALKARLWAKQGQLTEAFDWAQQRSLSFDGELSYMHEFEYIVFARMLIAKYQRDREKEDLFNALGLLERLLHLAEAGQRRRSVIEISLLQALAYLACAHRAQDDVAQCDLDPAIASLERALLFAEPEGFVRIFLDEGEPIVQLLTQLSAAAQDPELTVEEDAGKMQSYVNQLLAARETNRPQKDEPTHRTHGLEPDSFRQPLPETQTSPLLDPLSPRELEVLQLIALGLSNREISQRLFLALSTVKGHNRLIFDKLQVQRRTEAVARGRELGLV